MKHLDKNISISLFVVDWFGMGGSQSYIRECIDTAEKMHESVAVGLIYHGKKPDLPKFKSVRLINLPLHYQSPLSFLERLKHSFELVAHFKSHSQLVIVTDYWINLLAFGLTSSLLGLFGFRRPLLRYQFHGWKYQELESSNTNQSLFNKIKLFSYSLLEKKSLHHFPERIFCFSQYANQLLADQDIKKTQIIKPGLTLSPTRKISKNTAKALLGFNAKFKLVVLVGRLEKRKGIEHFYQQIYPRISSTLRTKLKILLVTNLSSGDDLENTTSAIVSAGANSQTYWLHILTQPQLEIVYRAADLVLMPSLTLETYGFVAIEAMVCGARLLAYNSGALSEILPSDQLCPPNQPKIFAQRLELSLTSKSKTAKSNPKKIVGNWENYLKTVLVKIPWL